MNMKKSIGRDPTCDYIILDPPKRISRHHLDAEWTGKEYILTDLGSTNGTFVNNVKIKPRQPVRVTRTDKIILAGDYSLDLSKVFPSDSDATRILTDRKADIEETLIMTVKKPVDQKRDEKVIILDKDKTTIGEILEFEQTPYLTIGRNPDNKIVIHDAKVSRYHCKMRMLSPILIEVVDLNSTNGTFADGIKLTPGKSTLFASSVLLKLGQTVTLDLKKIFPALRIVEAPDKARVGPVGHSRKVDPGQPTEAEMKAFLELEEIWSEFTERHKTANEVSMKYTMGGSILGTAAALLVGGPATLIFTVGGGILGRYLASQKTSEIRDDLNYENMFLQAYACPRCKESFQKKPWVTIRDCFKCKTKYR